MRNKTCFYLFFFKGILLFSQSSELLLQQYNQGPSLDNYYSKIEVYLGLDFIRINTDIKTSPKVTMGENIEILINTSKTLGFITGIKRLPVKYKYVQSDFFVEDEITYYTIPFGVKVSPTKRTSLSFGGNYNILHKAIFFYEENSMVLKEIYPKGAFKDNSGFFFSLQYLVWKNISASLMYQFSKKEVLPLSNTSNSNRGLILSLKIKLFKSTKINR
jgi:hypothetical protein